MKAERKIYEITWINSIDEMYEVYLKSKGKEKKKIKLQLSELIKEEQKLTGRKIYNKI